MAKIDIGALLDGLRHQIRTALSEALHEHVDENVDINALQETFMTKLLSQCGHSRHISETLIHEN